MQYQTAIVYYYYYYYYYSKETFSTTYSHRICISTWIYSVSAHTCYRKHNILELLNDPDYFSYIPQLTNEY